MNTDATAIKKQRFDSLDTLRGVAAVCIVFFHLIGINHLKVNTNLNFIGLYFGMAVPLFYAVSAFSLYLGYFDKLNKKDNLIKYIIRRFLRIAPLFYIMIIVYILVFIFYFKAKVEINDILINMSLLFGLYPGKHESIVWAGWSIGVEFLFYLILPLIMIGIKNIKSSILWYCIMLLLGTMTFNLFSYYKLPLNYQYENLLTHMPFFITGIMAYFLYNWLKNHIKKESIAIIMFIVSIVLISLIINKNFIYKIDYIDMQRYIWSVVFLLWIVSLSIKPLFFIVNKVTTGIGQMSFSIYLWHPLIVFFMNPIHQKIYGLDINNNVSFLLCAAITFFILFFIAFYSYKYIEKPFMELGRG